MLRYSTCGTPLQEAHGPVRFPWCSAIERCWISRLLKPQSAAAVSESEPICSALSDTGCTLRQGGTLFLLSTQWVNWTRIYLCSVPVLYSLNDFCMTLTFRVCLVIMKLTQSLMELSSSWEATNCAATQEFTSILRYPKVLHLVHKSPPLVPILNQIDPVHTTPSYLSKSHFSIA
jgi:hypothetical protein